MAKPSWAGIGTASDPPLAGANGSPIQSVDFGDLPLQARYVIMKIKRTGERGTTERYWDPGRDGVTQFMNRSNDLPAGATYREYTALSKEATYTMTYADLENLTGRENRGLRRIGRDAVAQGAGDMARFDSGALRIVHDETNKRFFYTPCHYTGVIDDDSSTYYNPFFLVANIGEERHRFHGPAF